MIEYYNLAKYTKENHISWDTDLFIVLRRFFEWYYAKQSVSTNTSQMMLFPEPMTNIIFEDSSQGKFIEPEDGEYTTEDILNLFNT